ncbi:cAMP-responsive element modulator [Halotydeus destructor]|nr:cAMP-responsive element modulator [Halotydeus destructor]
MEDDEVNDEDSRDATNNIITVKPKTSSATVSVALPLRTNGQTVLLTAVGPTSAASRGGLVTSKTAGGQQSTSGLTAQAIAVPQAGGGVSIVQLVSNQASNVVQSVIQPANHQSVIQATGGVSLSKNLILVNKVGHGSVIQSTTESSDSGGEGGVQTVQLITRGNNNGELILPDNFEDESKKRREVLARRPSYRKILNELSSADIISSHQHHQLSAIHSSHNHNSNNDVKSETGSSVDSNSDPQSDSATISVGGQYIKVLPTSALQLAQGSQDGLQGIQTLTMTNASGTGGATGSIVQYATQGPDGQFFVPAYSNGNYSHYAPSSVTVSAADLQAYQIRTSGSSNSANLPQGVVMSPSGGNMGHGGHVVVHEEQSKKRELRLLKNREAAKECRRKKKEYIKCLENRVAVLENQNKALIEELKSLKELYCQKTD